VAIDSGQLTMRRKGSTQCVLETITGLRTPGFILQERNIRSSEEKWPNAMRYDSIAISYILNTITGVRKGLR